VSVVTEDVVVSNCYFNTPCQGVRIGCPSDDTIRNAVFRNIEFHGANAIGSQQPRHYLTVGDNGYLKTENILFENWTIESGGHPLQMFVGPNIKLRDFGHMTFRNFTVKSKRPFMVRGNAETKITDVHFENIKGSVAGKPFDITHASIDFGQIDVSVGK
jgi:polygalacturonase